MREFLHKYRHGIFALYLPIYLIGFFYLERKVTTEFTAMNSPLDDFIPFIGIFIIPYIAWFFYVGVSAVYFFFKSQREFVKMMTFLIIGMTAYLIICYVFPNGLTDFRPTDFDTTSFSGRLINWLYATDTSTNVFPSIHVYNSIGIHIAISRSKLFKHTWVKKASLLLCVLICFSTIFLKQHALIDVAGGCVMGGMVFELVYKTKLSDFIDKRTWE